MLFQLDYCASHVGLVAGLGRASNLGGTACHALRTTLEAVQSRITQFTDHVTLPKGITLVCIIDIETLRLIGLHEICEVDYVFQARDS